MHALFLRYPRLRRALQLAVPAAVAADTLRSCFVTYQLAQQRLAEWQEEDDQDTRRQVRQLLSRVVARCAATDKDFWPPALTPAAGGSGSAAAADGGGGSSGDMWQLLGLGGLAGAAPAEVEVGALAAWVAGGAAEPAAASGEIAAASAPAAAAAAAAEAAAFAEQEALQLLRFEQQAAAAAAAPSAAQRAQQAAAAVGAALNGGLAHAASQLASLSLPWSYLMAPPLEQHGVVRVTLSDAVDMLGASPPAAAARHSRERLASSLGASVRGAADAAASSLRAALPWPQLAVHRKSALRCSFEWHGMHWPDEEAELLERDLARC